MPFGPFFVQKTKNKMQKEEKKEEGRRVKDERKVYNAC